jgi:hypothetical protein
MAVGGLQPGLIGVRVTRIIGGVIVGSAGVRRKIHW